jgi:hypothetical protein
VGLPFLIKLHPHQFQGPKQLSATTREADVDIRSTLNVVERRIVAVGFCRRLEDSRRLDVGLGKREGPGGGGLT